MSGIESEDCGEVIVYEAPDGAVRVDVRLARETIWLNQQQMAELFGRALRPCEQISRPAVKQETSSTRSGETAWRDCSEPSSRRNDTAAHEVTPTRRAPGERKSPGAFRQPISSCRPCVSATPCTAAASAQPACR